MGLEQGSEKYFKLVLYLVVIVLINVAFLLSFLIRLGINILKIREDIRHCF